MKNLENQNDYFSDTLRFEGILRIEKGDVIVSSQSFVAGQPAEEDEVVDFFEQLGFESTGNYSYKYSSEGFKIFVYDARPDNVFKDQISMMIIPIDIQVKVTKG